MNLQDAYLRAPPSVQSIVASAAGVRERRRRYGGAYPAYVAELKAAEWLTADRLAAIQQVRLGAMVRFAAEHVPYYRDLFRSLSIHWSDLGTPSDLVALPILEKETVRANPDAFHAASSGERLIPATTGGTTGTPLRYLVSLRALQYNYATYDARFRHWAGVGLGDRMASINGRIIVPIDQKRPPYWRRNLAFNQLYLSAYHLSEGNLSAYVDRLRRFNPVMVVGYVSSVHTLARYILERGNVGAVRPRAVLVSSETLLPEVRADIEAAFGCRVFDGYSLGELTAFIGQCSEGSMHVSPEYGVIEFIQSGDQTEMVTTGLFNRGTVLLRYRTGDLATAVAASCGCGRSLPRTSPIGGRVDDAVVTAEGVRVGPATLSLAFQSCPGIREAQIVQAEAGSATVLLVTTLKFGTEEQSHLQGELAARLGRSMRLEFEHVAEIPRTVSGKRRFIVSAAAR